MNIDHSSLPSWRVTYHRLLMACGSQAPALQRSLVALLAAAVLQGLALACLYPVLMALFAQSNPDGVGWGLALMAGLSAAAIACRWYGQGFEYQGYLARATHELRMRLGIQLRQVPLAHVQRARAGEMSALLLGNVDENLNYVLAIANLLAQAVVTPLTVTGITLFVDVRLGITLLLLFPLIVPLYRWRRPIMARRMQALNAAHQTLSADIVEYVQGQAVLRATCQAQTQCASLASDFVQLQQLQTQAQRNNAQPDALIASIVELGLQGVMVLGVAWVVNGSLNLAALAAAMIIIARFTEPLANCISYTLVLEMVESALQRIEALLAIAPLPVRVPTQVPQSGEIDFHQVTFSYSTTLAQTSPVALRDVSVHIGAGQRVALVGPSGSGKTTLARLLLRYADPQQGTITLGGIDVRHMTPAALNQSLSVVFQDVYLFDDTVLANLRMAKPDATLDELETAARGAQCLDFINRLPQGWDTPLGERGMRLSGGERQRLSIARALLKNAPIVILDEPTAALDTESELAVQQALDNLMRQRTVIIIAHRLSTIVGADHIVVMDNGRVVQQGEHHRLIACEGRYRTLWQAQQCVKTWHLAADNATATQ